MQQQQLLSQELERADVLMTGPTPCRLLPSQMSLWPRTWEQDARTAARGPESSHLSAGGNVSVQEGADLTSPASETPSVSFTEQCPPSLCFAPGLRRHVTAGVYVTQLSILIRLTEGLSPPSDRPTGSMWKSSLCCCCCCCSSRSLPPSWELQEELMLSAGDLPISALADEWGFGRGVMYPDWLRWSRGGEMGSALMLTCEPSWCCCQAAMEPKEGPAGQLKPDSSAMLRDVGGEDVGGVSIRALTASVLLLVQGLRDDDIGCFVDSKELQQEGTEYQGSPTNQQALKTSNKGFISSSSTAYAFALVMCLALRSLDDPWASSTHKVTLPLSMTRIRSAWSTVLIRWAMVSMVQSLKASWMVFWIKINGENLPLQISSKNIPLKTDLRRFNAHSKEIMKALETSETNKAMDRPTP
ncbi:hypothetical protein EYF80_030998 [Liparis tanakae]|uniref:Uncharacterized protein n=1 Tax=Liparis tanakae TaxID=230148 RepID=A0A4Z2H102_9TELE|nr:hypothetical protein EYF80_030998 [Liparis tanakae]